MYSPYPATVVFAILQLIVFMIATAMQSCKIEEGVLKIPYYIVMTVMIILEVLLLFSVSIGVGASGYDTSAKNCFLLQ